jgi:hypothetical protein
MLNPYGTIGPHRGAPVLKPVHISLLILSTAGFGCAKEPGTSVYGDTGNDLLHDPGPEHIDGDDCTVLSVEANGRALDNVGDPMVGDYWTIRMFCDDVLMTGANLLKFTPPNVAVVATDMTDATFVTAGDATMLLQSGNIQFTTDLVVLPAQ